ncbi:acyl-CoA N-acyltransferase [Aspergillus insuetus]
MAAWRPLTLDDIPALMTIANKIHTDLPERPEIFAERIALYPSGCLALEHEKDKQLLGYAISHPIRRGEPPELDTLLGGKYMQINAGTPNAAYYIHDVAVLPEVRGMRYAGKGVELLLENAAESGFSVVCLVSVYGTEQFWGRYGFNKVEIGEGWKGKLEGYGEDAVYLEREGV